MGQLGFAVLSSGSRANCTYVTDGSVQILFDCGLSSRETEKRLKELGIDPTGIDAIVVSHEHSDHLAGIPIFAKRHCLPVYANDGTLDGGGRYLAGVRLEKFLTGYSFEIGSVRIDPFSVSHDANDPVGFRVRAGNVALGIVTDLGHVTSLVRERTKDLDALILESNHDRDLLQAAPYPWELKQRISGRSGHLQNDDACSLFEEVGQSLSVIVGAHISEKANHPELVVDGFTRVCGRNGWSLEVVTASAHFPSRLFQLDSEEIERTREERMSEMPVEREGDNSLEQPDIFS